MPLTLRDAATHVVGPAEPRTPDRGSARAALAPTMAVMALYLLIAVALNWDAWSEGAASHMQAGADQFTTAWFLRWLPFALLHGHNPLYTDFGNYPFGVNLLNNTSVPLLGLAGAPVTLLFGPIATSNTLSTLALAGSAAAGYCFARRWTEWRPAAFTAGLLYGFSPYEIAESNGGHLNLTFVVLPPLILLAVHQVIMGREETGRGRGIALGLLVTAQFFISSEILVSTVIIGACCVAAAAVIGHRSVRPHLPRRAQWAGDGRSRCRASCWPTRSGSPSGVRPTSEAPSSWSPRRTGPTCSGRWCPTSTPGWHLPAWSRWRTASPTTPRRTAPTSGSPSSSPWPWAPSCSGVGARSSGWRPSVGRRPSSCPSGGALVVHRPPGAYLTGLPLARARLHQAPAAGQHGPGALLALRHPVRRAGPGPHPRPAAHRLACGWRRGSGAPGGPLPWVGPWARGPGLPGPARPQRRPSPGSWGSGRRPISRHRR